MAGKTPKHLTRAPERDERVALIERKMRSLEWVRGETGHALAREWGLSVKTLESDAAEASRRIRSSIKDPDATTADVACILTQALRDAMLASRDPLLQADATRARKNVVDLARLTLELCGEIGGGKQAPQVQVSVVAQRQWDELQRLTPEELDGEIRRLSERYREAIAVTTTGEAAPIPMTRGEKE